MFSVSRNKNRAAGLAPASAQWVESSFVSTRRHYKIVALGKSDVLPAVQRKLRQTLGRLPIKAAVTRLVACDQEIGRLCMEFDASDAELTGVNETVRRLCTLPGVRYLRLDPRAN